MNSYVENSEANTYFSERYNSGEWDIASEADKTKALNSATELIDRLNFIGDKTDEDQELEFPRGGDTEYPEDIKIATMLIAYALVTGRDVEYDHQLLGQTTASTQVGRLVTDPTTVDIAKVHNIPSVVAWGFLFPYLRDGRGVTLSRVS